MDVMVTGEVVDCGSGNDTIKNCEAKHRGTPPSARMMVESAVFGGGSGNAATGLSDRTTR